MASTSKRLAHNSSGLNPEGALPIRNNTMNVEEVVRNASSSFYWAMRILPAKKRTAIFAVYAFCRDVDDIVDEEAPDHHKKICLDRWRQDIDTLYKGEGELQNSLAEALIEPIRIYQLQRADFEAVIDGMAMDAAAQIIAPKASQLDLYCDRVACAVGRLCVYIFGEPNEKGRQVADNLGRALQFTNILRDVHEDAERGRLYLPEELLNQYGIPIPATPEEVEQVVRHPAYPALWRHLAQKTFNYYDASKKAMAACDHRKIKPARIMMEVYQRDLKRMAALSDTIIADPTTIPKRTSKAARLLIALRYAFL